MALSPHVRGETAEGQNVKAVGYLMVAELHIAAEEP
jgi:hypothetical protein